MSLFTRSSKAFILSLSAAAAVCNITHGDNHSCVTGAAALKLWLSSQGLYTGAHLADARSPYDIVDDVRQFNEKKELQQAIEASRIEADKQRMDALLAKAQEMTAEDKRKRVAILLAKAMEDFEEMKITINDADHEYIKHLCNSGKTLQQITNIFMEDQLNSEEIV